MENYKELGFKLLEDYEHKSESRSGETISRYGEQLQFDLRDGLPMLTTKFLPIRIMATEVKWYLLGTPSIEYLTENNVKIWNEWADENNEIGPTYGVQWRDFNQAGQVDQVAEVIKSIKENPESRRHIINGWNPLQLDDMILPPCLVMMQFHVADDLLHLTVTQRSADFCLGVPFDIVEMALILELVAKITGKTAAKLTMNYGDIHIYTNHIETLKEQLANPVGQLPTIEYKGELTDIDDYDPSKWELKGYKSRKDMPVYNFDVAV